MIEATQNGVRFRVWVQPRASRTELAGLREGALRIRIAAPPVDNEANEVLVRFLAKRLGVPRSAVSVAAGATSRAKTIEVTGIDADVARRLLV